MKYDVHTAAGRHGKRTLLIRAGNIAIGTKPAHQKFGERYEIIEFAIVQTGTKKVSKKSAFGSVGAHGSVKPIVPEFRGQPQPAIGIVRKRSRAALIVPRRKRVTGIEVDVAVPRCQFKLRYHQAWCLIRAIARRRSSWERFR